MTLLLALLPALPLLAALLLAVLPGSARDRLGPPLGVLVTGLLVPVSWVAPRGPDLDEPWVPALGVRMHLGLDGVSGPFVVLTTALTFLCLCHLAKVRPDAGRVGALVALLLVVEAGVLATFLALDLLLFFVAFEAVLVPMYFVIAVWGGHGSGAAARTFVLYTLLGSAVMLLGLLLLRAETGTSDLVALAGADPTGTRAGLAALALTLGLAVKVPVWPLHTWLPPAHTAAPTVGSVLLAGVLLKMGVYGLIRLVVAPLPSEFADLAPYVAAFGVVGILWGALACLVQQDLKRLIAYSSVAHMGFVVLGLATMTPAGLNGAVFASVAHGAITGLLFFLAGGLKDRHGSVDLAALGRGLYARAPRLGGLLAFAAVASLGLPGLAGFWGEMLAMLGAWSPAEGLPVGLFRTLMVLAGLGTVLAAAYLLRVLRLLAQGPVTDDAPLLCDPMRYDLTRHEALVWAPLVAVVLVLGLAPFLLLEVVDPAVRAGVLGGGAP